MAKPINARGGRVTLIRRTSQGGGRGVGGKGRGGKSVARTGERVLGYSLQKAGLVVHWMGAEVGKET